MKKLDDLDKRIIVDICKELNISVNYNDLDSWDTDDLISLIEDIYGCYVSKKEELENLEEYYKEIKEND